MDAALQKSRAQHSTATLWGKFARRRITVASFPGSAGTERAAAPAAAGAFEHAAQKEECKWQSKYVRS